MIRVNLISPRSLFCSTATLHNTCNASQINDLLRAVSLCISGNQENSRHPEQDSASDVTFRPLPAELLLLMLRGEHLAERVMAYLASAEALEADPWLCDDIHIAWLTVLHCAEGISQPWEYAFWRYLGKHPDKLIPFFVERAEKHRIMESGGGVCAKRERGAAHSEALTALGCVGSTVGTQSGPPVTLYQTAQAEISLPPRKPVSKVASPRKRSA